MEIYYEDVFDDYDWTYTKSGRVVIYNPIKDKVRIFHVADRRFEEIESLEKLFFHDPSRDLNGRSNVFLELTFAISTINEDEKQISWARWKSGKIIVKEIPEDYFMIGIKHCWPDFFNTLTKNTDYDTDISNVLPHSNALDRNLTDDEWESCSDPDDED